MQIGVNKAHKSGVTNLHKCLVGLGLQYHL